MLEWVSINVSKYELANFTANVLFADNLLFHRFAAEFVIDLAEKQPTFDGFKALLLQNGAEFTVGSTLNPAESMM